MANWFDIANIDVLDTPALVVYPDRVNNNLVTLVSSIDDVNRLRPHVKTHKNKEAALLTMAAGISKFKCATIAEAEMLALCKAPDVLLAYQPIGPKVNRLISLIKQYQNTRFACLIDNYPATKNISDEALKNDLHIDVYIDINVGMNRSGIAPQNVFALYQQCAELPGINIKGLHVYDGHIRDEDIKDRAEHCNVAFAPVDDLIKQLKAIGFDPIVIAGGSPSFPVHAARPNVQCSPGTFIYWDYGYGNTLREQKFLTAALVVTRVISLPDDTKICVDLGHKSIASENVLDKRVIFLNAPDLMPVSQSEEHLVLEVGAGHSYKVGDVLYGLPYHICPTVALYERAITIVDNQADGEWKNIARDRKINI